MDLPAQSNVVDLPPAKPRKFGAWWLWLVIVLCVLLAVAPWVCAEWVRANNLAFRTRVAIEPGADPTSLLPELDQERDLSTSANGVFAIYRNRARVTAVDFTSPEQALAQWATSWDEREFGPVSGVRFSFGGEHIYRGQVLGYEFVQWTNGPWLLQFAAPTAPELLDIVYASPLIELPGEAGYRQTRRDWRLIVLADYPWLGSLLGLGLVWLPVLGILARRRRQTGRGRSTPPPPQQAA